MAQIEQNEKGGVGGMVNTIYPPEKSPEMKTRPSGGSKGYLDGGWGCQS